MKYRRTFGLTKKKTKRIKTFFSVLFSLIFIGIIVYSLFFSGFFSVKNIVIQGNEKVPTKEIRSVVKEKLKEKQFYIILNNLFLADLQKLEKDILAISPKLLQIQVRRELPDTIRVRVQEREKVAQLCFEGKFFLLDKEGVIFEKRKKAVSSLLKIKNNNLEKNINLGERIIEANFLSKLLDFYSNLSDLKLGIESFNIIAEDRVNIKMEEGWKIYLDPQKDVDWQFTKLNTVLKEYLSSEERRKVKYIELRFGNTAPIKKK